MALVYLGSLVDESCRGDLTGGRVVLPTLSLFASRDVAGTSLCMKSRLGDVFLHISLGVVPPPRGRRSNRSKVTLGSWEANNSHIFRYI